MNSPSASLPPFAQLVDFRAALSHALRPPSLGRRAFELLGVAALVGTLFWFTLHDLMLTGLIAGIALVHEASVWGAASMLGLKRRSNTWLRVVESSAPRTDAWRESLVALAGPIAGLSLAVGFTVHALHGSHPGYARDGYVIGLFNGFMLLPVYPLDGGRFFHALFFMRAPSKGVLFRILASMGLIAGGVYSRQLWPLFFALVPLYAFKDCLTLELLGQSLRLRERGVLPDDEVLIRELRRSFPRERRPETLAAKALRLKALIARTNPSTGAAVALVGLYAVASAAAIAVIWFPTVLG